MSSERTHATARLPLRLPADLLDQVTAHAAGRGEDRSEWVRRAMREQMVRDRISDEARRVREFKPQNLFEEPPRE